MCQNILKNASFYLALFELDTLTMKKVQGGACPICKEPLDASNYYRKPRGGPANLPDNINLCYSFCCRKDGCRKRCKPPSVRFLGPAVYFAVVLILSTCLTQGLSIKRSKRLKEMGLNISIRTLNRWIKWWRDEFHKTKLWQSIAGLFSLEEKKFPYSLLNYYRKIFPVEESAVTKLLEVLAPINQR